MLDGKPAGSLEFPPVSPFHIVLDDILLDTIERDGNNGREIVFMFRTRNPLLPVLIEIPWTRLDFIRLLKTWNDHIGKLTPDEL